MRNFKPVPDELLNNLRYCINSNKLIWLNGTPVKYYTNRDGYNCISWKGKTFLVHRVIYTIANGPIKDGYFIDHINRIRHDNRIQNLREVTQGENNKNCTPSPKHNTLRSVFKNKTFCKNL